MNENSMIKVAETLLQPEVRAAIRANPRQYAIDEGIIKADSHVEIKLVGGEAEQMFLPLFRADAGHSLSHGQLKNVAAGATTGTVASLGCGSSAGTICTTASTASSVGCLGTIGSGGE